MTDSGVAEGTKLWEPSAEVRSNARVTQYLKWLKERGIDPAGDADAGGTYAALHTWSVTELEAFWKSIWEYFDVQATGDASVVFSERGMPGTQWFPEVALSYAEHALRPAKTAGDRPALVYQREDGHSETLTYAELEDQVARARAGLKRLGVGRGDRVAGFVPNSPEAIVAFLATASLGATWSSASPEFGVKSVLDRFGQIGPKVLIATDAYPYGGKLFDRAAAVSEIRAGLPTLLHTVLIGRRESAAAELAETIPWGDFLKEKEALEFERVPFAHPLYILYSSGTTGLPKPIVHGHGGILLEHFKSLGLHCDLGPEDRFFWFTTTGWMMWNFLVSGLLLGSTVVLYEGNPGHPDLSALWRFAEVEKVTYFGTSAPFLIACKKAGLTPGKQHDLSTLRGLGSTGAPLPADGFGWVYEAVSKDLLLGSVSGGTDVCTAFVGSCPLLPVYAGEIQCAELGCKVESFDSKGEPAIGEVGELVITEPMPSMPVGFWSDPDGRRYKESYFGVYPNIWRHGDWIKFTERGSCVIYGRSDSTLNRGGVRMGTSEFYRVVDGFPAVADSLVIDTGTLDQEGKLWLFVVLAPGAEWSEELEKQVRTALRKELSPRHVPDEVRTIGDVPRTISGKKLEVPIKRILGGVPVEKALNRGTLANPEAVDSVLKAAGHSAV